MIDLIRFTLQKHHWRELSALAIGVRFRNRATGDATPTNVSYRVDCLTTGAVVLDWTALPPAFSNPLTLTITPDQNAALGCRPYEIKQLTVAADYNTSTQFIDSTQWTVENVQGVYAA